MKTTKFKIKSIDFYRDCSTAGVLIEQDNGHLEEFRIHGHNFGNARIDVTGGGHQQLLTSIEDLELLSDALWEFEYDPELDWGVGEKAFMKQVYVLYGMVAVYIHYRNNTKDEVKQVEVKPIKTAEELEAEVVTAMSSQIEELMVKEALEHINNKYSSQK